MSKKIKLLIISCFSLQLMTAQVNMESELFQELKARDSLLFDRGFNLCKIAEFEGFVSDELEFYHDQGGLTTNKEDFLTAIRNNICSNEKMKPVRKLVPGSLQVFPMYNNGNLYAAIQKGEHEFFIKEPGKELYKTSSAKFTHVWELINQEWMLTKVLSYDHKSPE